MQPAALVKAPPLVMGEVSAPPNGQCPLPGPKAGTPGTRAAPGQSPEEGSQRNSGRETASSQFLEAVNLSGPWPRGGQAAISRPWREQIRDGGGAEMEEGGRRGLAQVAAERWRRECEPSTPQPQQQEELGKWFCWSRLPTPPCQPRGLSGPLALACSVCSVRQELSRSGVRTDQQKTPQLTSAQGLSARPGPPP